MFCKRKNIYMIVKIWKLVKYCNTFMYSLSGLWIYCLFVQIESLNRSLDRDYLSYATMLNMLKNDSPVFDSSKYSEMEILFQYFMKLVSFFGGNSDSLMWIVISVQLLLYGWLLPTLKHVKGLYVFSICMSPITVAFASNTIRQGFAMSLVWVVLLYISFKDGSKKFPKIITPLVCFGFHNSSVLVILHTFLNKFRTRYYIAFVLAALILTILSTRIESFQSLLESTAFLFDSPVAVRLNALEYKRLGGTIGPSFKYFGLCLFMVLFLCVTVRYASLQEEDFFGIKLVLLIAGFTMLFCYQPFHDRWDSWLWSLFTVVCLIVAERFCRSMDGIYES